MSGGCTRTNCATNQHSWRAADQSADEHAACGAGTLLDGVAAIVA
jgi:hypothetical protein